MIYQTEQEEFWNGEFGDAYIERNQDVRLTEANRYFFKRVLSAIPNGDIRNCIEFGANIGLNEDALHQLYPDLELDAIEINKKAVSFLKKKNYIRKIHHTSILNYEVQKAYDLVLIKGVLIHINPDALEAVYEKLYRSSQKYILLAEYYNPTPVEVAYRGYAARLFKRDFCGEMMDKYKDLALKDYGFVYHRDPVYPMGDVNWFLLQKQGK